MKIAITSDIHLEFGYWNPINPEAADTLILSGDIMIASKLADRDPNDYDHETRFIEFLEAAKANYQHVIYIMGNHEHYHGDFSLSAGILRKICDTYGIHFLDKENITLDDITFIGGTLWTDMDQGNPRVRENAASYMNDFRLVRNTPDKAFSTKDAIEDHKAMLKHIDDTITSFGKDRKYVVCGHHAPTTSSTKPGYGPDDLIQSAYNSDLTDFIYARPEIKLWTHGHTHSPYDYLVHETRVVCNPRGYVHYERQHNDKEPYLAKVVEV